MKTLTKGDTIKIDRFNTGVVGIYIVQRICRKHVNVKNQQDSWAMPNKRISDIIEIN